MNENRWTIRLTEWQIKSVWSDAGWQIKGVRSAGRPPHDWSDCILR